MIIIFVKYRHLLLLFLMPVFAASCSKYLEVQPEDKFLDRQVFTNKAAVQNALNGIYLNMAKPAMYGENLSATSLDVLAQYYSCPANSRFYQLSNFAFNENAPRKSMTDIWSSSYTAILNINLFIENLLISTSVVPKDERDWMLGEAFALKAFIAFDMLRLFGPVYSVKPSSISIPYPTMASNRIEPLLPANVVIDSIQSNLEKALAYLQNDPVRTEGIKAFANDGNNNYFRMRNRRMNYYGVQAFLARVMLYKGDLPGALAAATKVIEAGKEHFPWSPDNLSIPGMTNPDRIFSSEILFGLGNKDMYDSQLRWFAASNNDLLMPLPSKLDATYDGYLNDYRYRSCWEVDRFSSRTEKTFFKYADITDPGRPYRNFLPLIRMSEMYYIAAETEPDEGKAENYFNEVLTARGLPAVSFGGDRRSYITKEYEKEFWGEGQLFFYYKRINKPAIINGTTGNTNITMTDLKYVVPLPLIETQFR